MNLPLVARFTLSRAIAWRPNAENQLLARARSGDREAIGVLFQRHRDKILRLTFQILHDREAAEDAAQEILLRAFQKMPSFRGESEFSTWLYRLALNHCLETQRIRQRREALLESHLQVPIHSGSPAPRIEARLALEHALDELPEILRFVLILREWHELSYEEIAAILHLPVGTVRSRLHEARKKFRQSWEAQHGDL